MSEQKSFRYNSAKVRPKPQYIDGIRFVSQLEAQTYQTLKKHSKVSDINTQTRVQLMPKNSQYKAKFWRIDFSFTWNNEHVVYLEAKGIVDTTIVNNSRILSEHNPDIFSRFIIVAPMTTINRQCNKLRSLYVPYCVAEKLQSRLGITVAQLTPTGIDAIQQKLILD
jgi:hypothetical protein